MKALRLLLLLLYVAFALPANAITAWYQPTPYPSKTQPGIHVWDGVA